MSSVYVKATSIWISVRPRAMRFYPFGGNDFREPVLRAQGVAELPGW